MIDLKEVVSTFSLEEQQGFISYLKKKNKRPDNKNIQLFKLLLDESLSSKDIYITLYNHHRSGAYHALRKRLFQSIINFSANTSLEAENSIQMEVIRYILAARNYLQQKQYKTASKILNKAEAIATEHHLFPLLNEIYTTKIQFAYATPDTDLDEIINKFNSNKEKHFLEDQLNIVYSKLKHKLAHGDASDFKSKLEETLQEYQFDIIDKLSFKSLYQLISIITISAFATNDNLNIETFLIETYQSILDRKDKDKQPFYHIQILYHIANTLFRNKKFKTSEAYLKQMHHLMLQHKNKYYNTFKLKYHLLLSLNYNFSNRQAEAIDLLEPFLNKTHTDIESVLDIHLSVVMFYFQNNQLKKAHQVLAKFYHSDAWYVEKSDIEWVIKKNLIEILLHIDLGNTDLAESKFLSFKRRYFDYLKSINQQRVIQYLSLVETYYKHPETITSDEFKTLVENSFEWTTPEKEDIFVMSFYAWLKSKMTKVSLYDTTMQLILKA